MFYKKFFVLTLLLISLAVNPTSAEEYKITNTPPSDIQAVETTQESKYPDYAKMYAGDDKYEKFNRKMFNLNSRLNKYIARPVHIIWSSIMPKFGIDRIRDAYNNIEYPKRLASCILQRDGQGIKIETIRFLTNTTLGLGGLFDPADKILKIKPTNENMEQALCKCKLNQGSYLVMPILHSCTPRSLCGRALEAALDPSVYLATPIVSAIKFGLMLNKTSYMQPLAHMIETTYADPYDIHKKLFGLENYIRNSNLDRKDLLAEEKELVEEGHSELAEELIANIGDKQAEVHPEKVFEEVIPNILNPAIKDILPINTTSIDADIILDDYKPQTPVVDSMRTALFEDPKIHKSMWNELSVWNRSFSKRIKAGKVLVTENKPEYVYKYILQKDKSAPLVILYPSIGEGAGAHHSEVFAKKFYDEGYSVVMQGSHFHWEFAKSMPDDYHPGLPVIDSEKVQYVTSKILDDLEKKYDCNFESKTIVGTSLGAFTTLFVADRESKLPVINAQKYIAISPPIELKYAICQLDKNGDEFDKNSDEVKQKTAVTAAKLLQLYELKDDGKFNFETMPFSDEEGKMITTFILRQKLSDLIFTLENISKSQKTDIYEMINNLGYRDYAEKYLGITNWEEHDITAENTKITTLYSLSVFLTNNDNYSIYESFDDYFINKNQLAKLKELAGKHLKCINCGAHLGYLYRKEFESKLISDIKGIN